jgi:hypothetical protein
LSFIENRVERWQNAVLIYSNVIEIKTIIRRISPSNRHISRMLREAPTTQLYRIGRIAIGKNIEVLPPETEQVVSAEFHSGGTRFEYQPRNRLS